MGDPIVESAARKGSAELLILASLEDGQYLFAEIADERFAVAAIMGEHAPGAAVIANEQRHRRGAHRA